MAQVDSCICQAGFLVMLLVAYRVTLPHSTQIPLGSAAVQITVNSAQNHRCTLCLTKHKIFNIFMYNLRQAVH